MTRRNMWGAVVFTGALFLAVMFWRLRQDQLEPQEPRAVVAATAPTGVVQISEERQHKIGITVEPVTRNPIRSGLRLTGEIAPVPGTQVAVTSPVSGRIVADKEAASLTVGSRVENGQVLAVIESFATGAAGLGTEAQLRQEEAFYARVAADRDRAQRLYDAGLIALKDLQLAEADFQAAKGRLEALKKELELYRSLQFSRAEERQPGRFWIRAPIGGVISDWKITAGRTVAADEMLAIINDITSVIAEAHLFVDDLPRVRAGQTAICTSETYPGETFRGAVSYIGPQIETGTRVVPMHIRLPNADARLRLGMPIDVFTEIGPVRTALVVPREAVIFEEGVQVVFVQVSPDSFERRVVRLGEVAPSGIEIRDGLREGEKVVVRGAFLIKAEALKAAFPPAEAGESDEERKRK